MDPLSLTIGLCLIGSSLLTAGLSVPMALGRTRRNPLYGVRLAASFASDEAWDAINRYGGRQMIAAAVPIIFTGVVALWVPLQTRPLWSLAFLGVLPLSMAVALVRIVRIVRIVRFANAYARTGPPLNTAAGVNEP